MLTKTNFGTLKKLPVTYMYYFHVVLFQLSSTEKSHIFYIYVSTYYFISTKCFKN